MFEYLVMNSKFLIFKWIFSMCLVFEYWVTCLTPICSTVHLIQHHVISLQLERGAGFGNIMLLLNESKELDMPFANCVLLVQVALYRKVQPNQSFKRQTPINFMILKILIYNCHTSLKLNVKSGFTSNQINIPDIKINHLIIY